MLEGDVVQESLPYGERAVSRRRRAGAQATDPASRAGAPATPATPPPGARGADAAQSARVEMARVVWPAPRINTAAPAADMSNESSPVAMRRVTWPMPRIHNAVSNSLPIGDPGAAQCGLGAWALPRAPCGVPEGTAASGTLRVLMRAHCVGAAWEVMGPIHCELQSAALAPRAVCSKIAYMCLIWMEARCAVPLPMQRGGKAAAAGALHEAAR